MRDVSIADVEQIHSRMFPLRMNVKFSKPYFYHSGGLLPEPNEKLTGLIKEISNRSGLQGIPINTDVGVEPNEPYQSYLTKAGGAELGFGYRYSLTRAWKRHTSPGEIQQKMVTALNDPSLWKKMTTEYDIASIGLGDETYSFKNGQVIKSAEAKTEPGRPNKTPIASAEQRYTT